MGDSQENAGEVTTEKQITLEEAHLQMGDLVKLQAQSNDAERYSVRLLGMAKGRSVMVTTPMIDGKCLLMREGTAFVLRAFSGKSAFAFSTQILKSVNTPFPYLHLAYPREVKSLVVRRGARANVKVICAITECDDAPMQAAGIIINLSVGGALVAVRQPPGEKGQRLTIKFKVVVNGVEALLELPAVIRAINVDHTGDADTAYHLGVQFVDVTASATIPMLAFVYHQLLEQSLGA
ncbi:MAG: flagellar brake protein [Betaproteobacteria bacterium]|nr:flagellar brake protein [Betaproteobacteria bacterium]